MIDLSLKTQLASIPDLNYVAIDVELANASYQSLCAIGVAVVKDGNVSQVVYSLIKPHPAYSDFSPIHKRIHGISSDAVKDSPSLIDIWPRLQTYFEGSTVVVAHNAGFDVAVLRHSLEAYAIRLVDFDYCCSMLIAKQQLPHLPSHTLKDLLNHYEYSLSNHHHAGFDAYHCALISRHLVPLRFARQIGQPKAANHEDRLKKTQAFFKLQTKEANLEGLAWDDLDAGAGPDFFVGKRFVLTGDFIKYERDVLSQLLTDKGGIKQSSVNGKTNCFIVGNGAGWSKVEKARAMRDQGQSIHIINEEELYQILAALDNQ